MNILITNDDGIEAHGIMRLVAAAKKYGNIWVVAPESQRSAASHSITLRTSITAKKFSFPVEGVNAYAVSGMPADCVRIACRGLMPVKPDIIFSGINFGYNAGTDVQYSATMGAAMEGIFQGVPSIAFSEGFSEDSRQLTDEHLDEILKLVIPKANTGHVVNVNFPDCNKADFAGILENRICSKTCIFDDEYTKKTLSDGVLEFMVNGQYQEIAESNSDLHALFTKHISIGPVYNIG